MIVDNICEGSAAAFDIIFRVTQPGFLVLSHIWHFESIES